MASDYPASLDELGAMESHGDLGDAIDAVQAELGADPAGEYDTVALRLAALLEVPETPTEITGVQGSADTAILAALLAALDALGLIDDATTTE